MDFLFQAHYNIFFHLGVGNHQMWQNYGKKKKKVRHIKKFSYLDDEAKLAESLGIQALPAVVVVDENGKVIKRINGHPNRKQMKALKKVMSK